MEKNILKIFFNESNQLEISINPYVILFLILIILFIAYRTFKFTKIDIDSAEFGIGTNKIVLKLNRQDIQLAYKIWVELNTRKIGIPIEENKDIIIDIYKSWYDFFGITRSIIKEIGYTHLKDSKSYSNLVLLSIDILNLGIRPHLTTWQSDFIHWYNIEISKDNNKDMTPLQIQKLYPKYDELIRDLKSTNKNLIKYKDRLKQIINNY